MDAPAVSLPRKIIAAFATLSLTLAMAPVAWADDAPAPTLAGTVAGNAAAADASEDGQGAPDAIADGAEAPEADLQSAATAAADGGSGGTTISIAVYRSSFPIVEWSLNDDDYGLTRASWPWQDANGTLPESGSPGAVVEWERPDGYAEPTRDGFEFAGWSTNPSASAGGYIDGSAPALAMPGDAPEAKSYTLYALWTPNEYSVIFDLTKNPNVDEGPLAEDGFALNWDSADGVRTVKKLANGRYQVLGFTMKEEGYDPTTRTVGLPEPSRTGYRFLGWSEPDGQALVQDNAAKDGFALNPVRLTRIDGTPVLTARWASAFGVTAPLSVTFGDYDKTGAPGNPWLGDANASAGDDTTQSEADDTTKDERSGYEALGQAYFENTGWHEAVKVVALSSERNASANEVLTTYDSKQASEAAVLGDGTAANPGERLLSLYPSASAPDDKSTGVHFRLSDSLDETALGSTFTMGAQGSGSERLPITYGLNLSTDPTDGSANHGLVLPTNDYERKQIATISYTFATATAADEDPSKGHAPTATGSTSDAFYIEYQGKIYGPADIKASAECIAEHGTESPCYPLYREFLASGMNPSEPDDPHGYVKWGDGTTYYVRIIGLNYDTKQDGTKAGITFQFVRLLKTPYAFKDGGTTNAGGWGSSTLRTAMNSGAIWQQVPAQLAAIIAPVEKKYRNNTVDKGGTIVTGSYDKLFLPAYAEVVEAPSTGWSPTNVWSSFKAERSDESRAYGFYSIDDSGSSTPHTSLTRYVETSQAIVTGSIQSWWLRSTTPTNDLAFVNVNTAGTLGGNGMIVTSKLYVCPCFAL